MRIKKIHKFILLSFVFSAALYSQYQIKSEYLINPEKNIEYIVDEAEYWKAFYDDENGGFFSFVDGNGNVTEDDVKALCPQSRLGYAYARAFMVTGDTSYLDYAHRALKFLYRHGWDETNGGWYFTTDRTGEITDGQGWWDKWNTTKQSFQQHYALLGAGAVCEATGGDMDWGRFLDDPAQSGTLSDRDWLMRGYEILMTKMWDARPDYAGHFALADWNWANPRDKGFTPVGDAMTTNAIIIYLLTQNEDIKQRLLTIADNVVDHLAVSMDNADVKLGFAEVYNSDWEINTAKHKHLLGHVYKAAWCVSRAYLIDPQEKYRTTAQKLLNHMWDDGGYDREYGGPYKKYDWESGVITDSSKNHWTLEQGALSGLINYYNADEPQLKERYLQMADESIDFYMNHLRDYTNGGSFSETNRAGTQITDSTKGNVFGADYHGTELAYFAYLYSRLFLQDSTITLYYYFQPQDAERTITLYPLAFSNAQLKISAIRYADSFYTAFDRDSRTITLPAGVGGIFKVTFENEETPDALSEKKIIRRNYTLFANYPNPFNPSTTIKYMIPEAEQHKVTLKVYNALGQEVAVLVNEAQTPGEYSKTFNAQALPSGIYYYRLECGAFSETKKMILIK
jgi:mannose/cellobiose epimerase-like protein (N-acyl-D-glucosamine 2-epimerase family)